MTTKESSTELRRIKIAATKEALEAETLKQKLNALLFSIEVESREIQLLSDEMLRVLSKLVKNTRYETTPKNRGANLSPENEFLVSDVYEFGKAPFYYKVWFERPGRSGAVFLYYSRIIRGSL